MKCQRCGHDNYQGDKYCRNCGNDLRVDVEVFNYCPKCRKNRSLNSAHCEECGSKLERFED